MTMDDYSLLGDNRSKSNLVQLYRYQWSIQFRKRPKSKTVDIFPTGHDKNPVPVRQRLGTWEIDADSTASEGFEEQILEAQKPLREEISDSLVFETWHHRRDSSEIFHPEKAFAGRKLQNKIVTSTLFRLYLRLTYYIAFDLYGINYLTKSDKLIENLIVTLKR